MKTIRLAAAIAMFGFLGVAGQGLMAQDAPPKAEEKPKEEPKAEEPKVEDTSVTGRLAKLFKGLDTITGKTEINEEAMKLVIKHQPGLEKVGKGDAEFKKAKESSFKEAHDYLLKNDKYLAWAKENSLDPADFLKKFLRVFTTHLKGEIETKLKEAIEGIPEQEKMLKTYKDSGDITEEEYNKYLKEIADGKADIEKAIKSLATLIPGPTEAEAKLLKDNAAELKKFEKDEDEEEGGAEEDDDGMGN